MEVKTELGKTYTVVSTTGGSVTTQDGTPVKTLVAGQDYFTAVSSVTVISDDEAIVQEVFKSAPIGGSGGGGGGTPGAPGAPGADGEDGISCTHSWNGTELIVASASGISSADLKGEKGEKGDKGDKGDTGPQGEPANLTGEPIETLTSSALTMQHAHWFDNSAQSAVTVSPATWNNEVITCYIKTSIPVTLSGVTWLYGQPTMTSGYTYVIALQQLDASTVLANLAYTLPQ